MLTKRTQKGESRATQANVTPTKNSTTPQVNPTKDIQRLRNPVWSPIVDVTNMKTATILAPSVFINVYAIIQPCMQGSF